jgi:hypothetical protein
MTENLSLSEFYIREGLNRDQWHIGPEHPYLEEFALGILSKKKLKRVLEIGYQAGGFAVPLILASQGDPGFSYAGIDNGSYANCVDKSIIEKYLDRNGIPREKYSFYRRDASKGLGKLEKKQFDLVLIDHYKPLYLREFYKILKTKLLAPEGVIIFHDVLGRASEIWKQCKRLCELTGCSWEVVETVPGGIGVVRQIKYFKPSFANNLSLVTATAGNSIKTSLHNFMTRLRPSNAGKMK